MRQKERWDPSTWREWLWERDTWHDSMPHGEGHGQLMEQLNRAIAEGIKTLAMLVSPIGWAQQKSGQKSKQKNSLMVNLPGHKTEMKGGQWIWRVKHKVPNTTRNDTSFKMSRMKMFDLKISHTYTCTYVCVLVWVNSDVNINVKYQRIIFLCSQEKQNWILI